MQKSILLLAILSLQVSVAHKHSHDQSEKAVLASQGIFEDEDVQARSLSDWEGDWQSIYPYLVSGDLDPMLALKAEKGDKTLEEYRAYYLKGYKTDLTSVAIHDNVIEYKSPTQVTSCEYKSSGHKILTYDSGKRGVRYLFECTDSQSQAPKYIQFSDHIIAPEKAGHFHLYMGNDSHETLALELSNWPTFYPTALSKEDIVDEMVGHDQHHGAHQHGVANMNVSIENGDVELALEGALANFISFEYAPKSDAEIAEVKAMVKHFSQMNQLIVLPKDAKCELKDVDLASDVIEASLLGQTHHHDKAHEHNHTETHGNLTVSAQWKCQSPEKLQQMNVQLFQYFPHLEHVEVQMITPKGQKSAELSSKNTVIQW